MTTKDLPWSDAPPEDRPVREVAAALLRALGAALDRLAVRLVHVQPQPPAVEPVLEFYAEAGAPEGALYVNGKLVGYLAGVTRL
jgi:hypothetical protein